MSKTNLIFPVKSFKRFDNPYDSDKEPAKYQFFMNTKDVPSELQHWLKVNPREQKLSTDVARDIIQSLESDKTNFHLLNRGLLISAEEIAYNNKTRMVTLILSDEEKHGIVDGGHTYKQILAYHQKNKNPFVDKYVQVEVIPKITNIEELAEARNNSVAVDDKSIEELRGSFDEIKKIIENQSIGGNNYFKRISFRQNEFWGNKSVTNIIDVREIIAIINMFNPQLYNPLTTPHPIQSYTGKEASLNKYLKLTPKDRKFQNNKEYRDSVIRNMSDIIPDVFSLWDKIETEFTMVSKDLNKRYGTKPYSNYNNDKIKKVSLFSNKELNYTIPKGIMYPVLGGFRALVKSDNGKCSWVINPFDVWENKKESIVSTILDNSSSFGNSPDRIGKSSLIWDSVFNLILIERLTKMNK